MAEKKETKNGLGTKELIQSCALKLFQEEGYENVTVVQICKEAGITSQTFYSLFTSRENVVVFTLQARYSFNPDEEMLSPSRRDTCELRRLCRSYSEYIEANRNFLLLLARNKIDYLLYDSIYEALSGCGCFLAQADPCVRRYAAAFYAGGISSVACCYAREGCTATAGELEEMLYTFFTGALF